MTTTTTDAAAGDEMQASAASQEKADATDWKAEARKWEARAKENKDAAVRLADLENTHATQQQELMERAEKAEQERDTYRAQAQQHEWRTQVSNKTGIPSSVLRGDTLDEIEAHAKALSANPPTRYSI